MYSIPYIRYVSNNEFFTTQLIRILHFVLRKFKFLYSFTIRWKTYVSFYLFLQGGFFLYIFL